MPKYNPPILFKYILKHEYINWKSWAFIALVSWYFRIQNLIKKLCCLCLKLHVFVICDKENTWATSWRGFLKQCLYVVMIFKLEIWFVLIVKNSQNVNQFYAFCLLEMNHIVYFRMYTNIPKVCFRADHIVYFRIYTNEYASIPEVCFSLLEQEYKSLLTRTQVKFVLAYCFQS